MNTTNEGRAWRIAHEALITGLANDEWARERGRLLEPVPIRAPGGASGGWFVGVALEGVLLGFIQVDAEGRYKRYASFRRKSDSVSGCPRVEDWLDLSLISERARSLAGPEDRLEPPVLTYDRSPDRLTWAVGAVSPSGRCKTILVAGEYVYLATESMEPSTN